MPDAKQKYTVSGGNIKFAGKWYKPKDTIELTATEKKQIFAIAHIKLTKVS